MRRGDEESLERHLATSLVEDSDDAGNGRTAKRAAPGAAPEACGAGRAQAAVAAIDDHGVGRPLQAHKARARVAVAVIAAGAGAGVCGERGWCG